MSRFEALWDGYLTDALSESELDEFLRLLRDGDQRVLTGLDGLLKEGSLTSPGDHERAEYLFQQVLAKVRRDHKPARVILWRRFAVAAAVIVVFVVGALFVMNQKKGSELAKAPAHIVPVGDVAPGGDKAVLTLADGRQIVLDSAGKGALAEQGGIQVINLEGSLAYRAEGKPTEVLYNTISTPRGGQYQLVLADGTKVWLNAASSLRFPTAFPGEERRVELTGEGYFEVAHNAAKPFHVKVLPNVPDDNAPGGNPMEVEVLGTQFNINGYSNEPTIKTTLVEGRVRLNKGGRDVYLNPGQQAVIEPGATDFRVKFDVDVDEVVAWKNGRFLFNSAGIETIMRQAERWYDVNVIYEGKISETFSGVVPRSENISQLLKILEATDRVNFTIRDKDVIVKPK